MLGQSDSITQPCDVCFALDSVHDPGSTSVQEKTTWWGNEQQNFF